MPKQFQHLKLLLPVLVMIISVSSHAQKQFTGIPVTVSKIKAVVALLTPGDIGPQVKNLITVLLLLTERSFIRSFEAPYHPTSDDLRNICAGARNEMSTSVFGQSTRGLVSYFQAQNGLGDAFSGNVENNTAAKLNELLMTLGVITATRQTH